LLSCARQDDLNSITRMSQVNILFCIVVGCQVSSQITGKVFSKTGLK
jgi:hypothetical protein